MSVRVWKDARDVRDKTPWRVTVRYGVRVDVHRFRDEGEARDFAALVTEHNPTNEEDAPEGASS